jgi:hypothetical protein
MGLDMRFLGGKWRIKIMATAKVMDSVACRKAKTKN